MQGGPRRGRSPITGPALLRAAQASQTPPDGGISCPKGRKRLQLYCGPKLRAAQAFQTPPEGGIPCPKGSKRLTLYEEAKLRAAQPFQTPPDDEILCPKGYERNYYELSKPFLK